jgi:DNA-binding winged helix-turn-helix (wHTH) protein
MRVLIVDPDHESCGKEGEPHGPLSFFFSPDLSGAEDFDLLVLPAEFYLVHSTALPSGLPVLAFGPIDFLADALAVGCADYMREPLLAEELEARALRLWNVRFSLDRETYRYSQGILEGRAGSLSLSQGERTSLELLLQRLGRAVPREAFLRTLAVRTPAMSRVVDMTLSRLRKRLALASGDRKAGAFLVSVRNYGYRLAGKRCG